MYGWVEGGFAAYTGPGYKYSVNPFFLPFPIVSKSSWLYSIRDAYANSWTHTSSTLSPTQWLWTRSHLACHLHEFLWSYLLESATYTMLVDTLPSGIPPTQCTWHLYREHLCPVYFRYQIHLQLFSFNQAPMSKGSSTQYPTTETEKIAWWSHCSDEQVDI